MERFVLGPFPALFSKSTNRLDDQFKNTRGE
jgi:hypothetical protein